MDNLGRTIQNYYIYAIITISVTVQVKSHEMARLQYTFMPY